MRLLTIREALTGESPSRLLSPRRVSSRMCVFHEFSRYAKSRFTSTSGVNFCEFPSASPAQKSLINKQNGEDCKLLLGNSCRACSVGIFLPSGQCISKCIVLPKYIRKCPTLLYTVKLNRSVFPSTKSITSRLFCGTTGSLANCH